MIRRGAVWSRLALLLATGIAASGCTAQPSDEGMRQPAFWVVLLDKSGSVEEDLPIYRDAVRRVIGSLQRGDRLILAAITGASGADFRVSIDESLPPAMPEQGWMDEPKAYERERASREKLEYDVRARIAEGTQQFLDGPAASTKTAIFESLLVIDPFFAADERRSYLVLLSDMLEESASVNFERLAPTESFTAREIERQVKSGTMPDLKGVTVCVAGAVATPPERAAAVERFWRAYFQRAGASIARGGYARTLAGCVD